MRLQSFTAAISATILFCLPVLLVSFFSGAPAHAEQILEEMPPPDFSPPPEFYEPVPPEAMGYSAPAEPPAGEPVKPEETLSTGEPAPPPPTLPVSPPVSEPEPTQIVQESSPGDSQARTAANLEDFDPRVPRFTHMRPSLAFEISGAIKAFGGKDLDRRQGGIHPTRAITFSMQLQPKFLQSAGVFSFGPALSLYPIPASSGATPTGFSLWAAGGQGQYQARFFREQIIVPVVGFTGEYMKYNFRNGPSGNLVTKGPYFGFYLLLNRIEPRAAADFYANHGVLRSYLVAEYRNLAGSDTNLTLGGNTIYFGVRIEH